MDGVDELLALRRDLRPFDTGVEVVGIATGETVASLPPFADLVLLFSGVDREGGGGEGEGNSRLGILRVRVVVRRAGVAPSLLALEVTF